MFGTADVEKLVKCAAGGLETEDRYLRKCEQRHGWPPNRFGLAGLRRNTNERYYQFVIWRELISSFPFLVETEREAYDFVFYDGANKPIAYAEIKGWWSNKGEDEIPGIRRDLDVKLGILRVPGVMLILTSHGGANAEENFEWLAGRLGVPRDHFIIRSFEASDFGGAPCEFAVIGFLAAPKV